MATRAVGSDLRNEAAGAVRIAAGLLALAALAGVAGWMTPAVARAWLGFGFGGIEPRLSEVLSILANNLRVLAAVLLACWAVQLARKAARDSGSFRAVVVICDAGLVAAAALHAVLIGLGVGAYGDRMVAALLPHGPIELVAYSFALALYLAARREPVGRERWLAVGLTSAACLAIAAPLEVFVST